MVQLNVFTVSNKELRYNFFIIAVRNYLYSVFRLDVEAYYVSFILLPKNTSS